MRFFGVYFVEKIKTSGSVRNQVAGGFPIYPSISDNVAWMDRTIAKNQFGQD
jgi:hypothetical protein